MSKVSETKRLIAQKEAIDRQTFTTLKDLRKEIFDVFIRFASTPCGDLICELCPFGKELCEIMQEITEKIESDKNVRI